LYPPPDRSIQLATERPTTLPVQKKLATEQSAMASADLIREIETLAEDELESRAIGILRAKNRLSADDAKRVEDAFANRKAVPGELSADLASDNAVSAPSNQGAPRPTQASTKAEKPPRPRSRPRKVKHEITAPAAVLSKPSAPDEQAALTPGKIQKSELTFGEVHRYRNKAHLRFVGSQPCLICGRTPADAHHLRFAQPRGMGLKVSDEFTVPLCRAHHRDNHGSGDEAAWSIDPVPLARALWISTRGNG
jgi:hypothetical protein